jgi:hypothetical protein
MEKRLRAACHASDANVDNVVKVSIFFSIVLSIIGYQGIQAQKLNCIINCIINYHHLSSNTQKA